MRHFRGALRERGVLVEYRELGVQPDSSLGTTLTDDLRRLRPEQVMLVQPGDWRVREELSAAARAAGVPLELPRTGTFSAAPLISPTGQVAARCCASSTSTDGCASAPAS